MDLIQKILQWKEKVVLLPSKEHAVSVIQNGDQKNLGFSSREFFG